MNKNSFKKIFLGFFLILVQFVLYFYSKVANLQHLLLRANKFDETSSKKIYPICNNSNHT